MPAVLGVVIRIWGSLRGAEQTAFGGDLVDTVSHLEIAAPR